MKKEEYNQKILELKKAHEEAANKVSREFAFSNKKHEKGDILSRGNKSIVIDEIRWTMTYSKNPIPLCVYVGRLLKKDGTFRKDGAIDRIWEDEPI